jgi:predicted HTH transcriptional regulator
MTVREIFDLRKQGRIEEATNIPSKSIERHIKALISLGLIEHRGSKKTGGYYVI